MATSASVPKEARIAEDAFAGAGGLGLGGGGLGLGGGGQATRPGAGVGTAVPALGALATVTPVSALRPAAFMDVTVAGLAATTDIVVIRAAADAVVVVTEKATVTLACRRWRPLEGAAVTLVMVMALALTDSRLAKEEVKEVACTAPNVAVV
jgi:hypothetical protein